MGEIMGKVILTTFTDPMMGLSYECEPLFRRLETHFEGKIEFRYIMAGLVRDVSDFMTAEERAETRRDPESGIARYCRRLADIYRSEEPISGMPIRMEGFHLFDAEHRSSWPLDVAFEAARLAAPDKAEQYLCRLRYATVFETRQTTKTEEQVRVAQLCGIDAEAFSRALTGSAAEAAFREDMETTRKLGIFGLPAFLLQYEERAVLIRFPAGYEEFVAAIRELTNGSILPGAAPLSEEAVAALIEKRHLVSLVELGEAFDAEDENALAEILEKLPAVGRVHVEGDGLFICK